MMRLLTMGVVGLLALAATACGGASAGNGGAPPPGADDGMETKTVMAPILEADVLTRESSPPRYAVRLLAEIGDGCNRFARVDVERDGNTIAITVLRTVPAHPEVVLCTMQYQTHEQTVELGSDFEAGREYTVLLNDGERTLTFSGR